jgi:hypothetical protein
MKATAQRVRHGFQVWLSAMTVCVIACGCSKETDTNCAKSGDEPLHNPQQSGTKQVCNAPTHQDSPRAVLEKMHKALLAKDKAAFADCFYAPGDLATFVAAHFEGCIVACDFTRKLQQTYGPDGVQRFEDFYSARAGMVFFRRPPLDKPWWEDIRFEVNGDRAEFYDPFAGYNRYLVCIRGCWRIDVSEYSGRVDREVANQRQARRELEACMADIGKPGVSVDDLRRKLGALDEATAKENEIRAAALREKAIATIRKSGGKVALKESGLSVDWCDAPISDADLAPLKDLPELDKLNLYGTAVSDAGINQLKGLEVLYSLNLGDTRVTDAGLAHLKNLPSLEVLGLIGTQVTDNGLAELKSLPALHWLNLTLTRVTDAGLKHLSMLPALDWLNLDHTKVTDAGLTDLPRSLKRLWLDGTAVTDHGLVELANLNELEVLSLAETRVSDTGLKNLSSLHKLTRLDISKTKVTSVGVKAIQEAIPGIKVEWKE